MSGGAIFVIVIVAAFPTLILVAMAVKLWEVHQAKSWLSAAGKVIASRVQSRQNKPGDAGYDFHDTEVTNEPFVQYEYKVGSQKLRCNRITIGEKTSAFELEEILARYPVGADVTVYYNPRKPEQAVLERELPGKILFLGMGVLMAFFIGGPLLLVFLYFNGLTWMKSHMANPQNAPFVTALSIFGLLVLLFALAFQKIVFDASRWPITRGKIIGSGTDAYQSRTISDGTSSRRTMYRPCVLYEYEVNGRKFQGDRVTIGTKVSATFSGLANRLAKRYPVGKEVNVRYNPKSPGESVLRPFSITHLLPWFMVIVIFTFVWAVATGRM